MKLAPAKVRGFLANPDPDTAVVLLYGPDQGVVAERYQALTRAVAGEPDDPFRVMTLNGDELRNDPVRLADEAMAMVFGGGRRVIRVRDATDQVTAALRRLPETVARSSLIILTAGELGPRASLRVFAETSRTAVALPCYGDSAAALRGLISQELAPFQVSLTPDAEAYVLASLGADRGTSRSELRKLALYAGEGARLEGTDVLAVIGDVSAVSLDALVDGVAGGDLEGLTRALRRAREEGSNPITWLRVVSAHVERLLRVHAVMQGGVPASQALATLRPPVFRLRQEAFLRQVRSCPMARLNEALGMLVRGEMACKTTGIPQDVLAERVLWDVALHLAGGPSAKRSRSLNRPS